MSKRASWWSPTHGELLKTEIAKRGTQGHVADKTGISRSALIEILAGRSAPKIDTLETITGHLGIKMDMFLDLRPVRADPSGLEDMFDVPLLEVKFAAGDGADGIERTGSSETLAFPRRWLRDTFPSPDALRIVKVQGDSMLPTLRDGAWLMLDTSQRTPAEAVFALRWYDQLYVKRLQRQGRMLRLVSDNPVYDPIEIDLENEADVASLELLGRAVWVGGML